MAMQVQAKQKKGVSLGTVGTLAGGAAGAMTAGVPGMSAGMAMGGAAGGLAEQAGDNSKPMVASAMQRRYDQLQADPVVPLAEAKAALPELPPEVRAAAEDPINRAYALAMKKYQEGIV